MFHGVSLWKREALSKSSLETVLETDQANKLAIIYNDEAGEIVTLFLGHDIERFDGQNI